MGSAMKHVFPKTFSTKRQDWNQCRSSTTPDHSIVSYLLLNTSNPIRHKSCDSHHCWPLLWHTWYVARSCSVQVLSLEAHCEKGTSEGYSWNCQQPHCPSTPSPQPRDKTTLSGQASGAQGSPMTPKLLPSHCHNRSPLSCKSAEECGHSRHARFHAVCAPSCRV